MIGSSTEKEAPFRAACKGILDYLNQHLQHATGKALNWEFLFDDLHFKERVGLLLKVNPSWPKEHCGPQGLALITLCQEPSKDHAFIPPLSIEKLRFIQQQLSLLNLDVTQDPAWQTYWQELFIKCQQTPLFQDEHVLQGAMQKAQNQILAAYQLGVISHCDFFKRHQDSNQSTAEFEINNIPHREFLQIISCYSCVYPAEQVFEKIEQDCHGYLKEQVEIALNNAKNSLKRGDLLATIRNAKNSISRLQYSLAFELLGKEAFDKAVLPLSQRLLSYEHLVQAMLNAIDKICARALPGVIIENEIREEIKIMQQADLFKKALDVGPLPISKFLHSAENIRSLHEKIITTRALHCKPLLNDSRNHFEKLSNELKKITVYRVRRHVIQKLFDMLNKDIAVQKKPPSLEQEECLLTLQEEYLQALARQIEKMPPQEVKPFVNKVRNNKILQPIKQAKLVKLKKDFMQKELDLIAKESMSSEGGNENKSEGTPLHDIDSPIEMDILGDMTRQIIALVGAYGTMILEEHESMMTMMQNSYQSLLSSDFQPEPHLWELIVELRNHENVNNILLSDPDLFYRREKIKALFEVVKEAKNFSDKRFKFFWDRTSSTQMRAMHLLLTIYLGTIESQLQEAELSYQRDKYMVYQTILKEALNSPLLQSACQRKETQHYYRECIALVEALLGKPVSPLPSILPLSCMNE